VTWTWHPLPREEVTLTLHQSLNKGEQVFNSYGPKSNEDLLASYGFVNDGMEDDTVTLKLGGSLKDGQSQQHYWRLNESCPPALLQEVRSILGQGDSQEVGDASSTELLEEGEAMDTIVDLLEQKLAVFDATQKENDSVDKTNSAAGIRDSVRHDVDVYRQSESPFCIRVKHFSLADTSLAGQSQILQSALKQAQSRLDAIEEALDQCKQSS
jgi:hypothetical protein